MPYKPIYSFDDSMEGKIVRFKNSVSLPNLTSQFGINKNHGEELHIPAGGLGLVYEVRGATLFVGFGRDLKLAPSKGMTPTSFSATVQFYLDNSHLLEIEN